LSFVDLPFHLELDLFAVASALVLESAATSFFGVAPPGTPLPVVNFTSSDQDVLPPFAGAAPAFAIVPPALQNAFPDCAVASPLSFGTILGGAGDALNFAVGPGDAAWGAWLALVRRTAADRPSHRSEGGPCLGRICTDQRRRRASAKVLR
jgi:hypothetical protein